MDRCGDFALDLINLPRCDDTFASDLFWSFLLGSFAGAGVTALLLKIKVFPFLSNFCGVVMLVAVLAASLGLAFWYDFDAVGVDKQYVKLHYLMPRPEIEIDASKIADVFVDTSLQQKRPTRVWKHRLSIKTADGKRYDSAWVCMDPKKVGVDYQSAIYTTLNDPVERAEDVVSFATVKSKLTSPRGKAIDPSTYGHLFVTQLRKARNLAASKTGTAAEKRKAFEKLNLLLKITQQGLGNSHYAVHIVYEFIGSAYAKGGNLTEAKKYFDLAKKISTSSPPQGWYSVAERIYDDGLSMSYYEHPDWPRTPIGALDY